MKSLGALLIVLGVLAALFISTLLGLAMVAVGLLCLLIKSSEAKKSASICPKCGNPVAPTAVICPTCRAELLATAGPLAPTGPPRCPKCGALAVNVNGRWECSHPKQPEASPPR